MSDLKYLKAYKLLPRYGGGRLGPGCLEPAAWKVFSVSKIKGFLNWRTEIDSI